jgi:hypothetical protein
MPGRFDLIGADGEQVGGAVRPSPEKMSRLSTSSIERVACPV